MSTDATSRRKSGRVIHKPDIFQPEAVNVLPQTNGSAKRKRGGGDAPPVADPADELDSDEDASEDDEGEPDEEEVREQRRKTKVRGTKKKPAQKKPKVGANDGVSLAMRPATNGVKRSSKPKKARAPRQAGAAAAEGSGLYAEVFVAENAPDDVATAWIERYNNNGAEALCELINFVLKCAGCEIGLDVQDIEDPDNAASRLAEIQDEFQAQKITEYPLISRSKNNDFSKDAFGEFLQAFVRNAHSSELVYKEEDLIEQIQTWISTMSSSLSRPFRHTATFVSLVMADEICKVIQEIAANTATTQRQKEGEEKKKSVNKARVASFQKALKDNEAKMTAVENWIKDVYNTIFVHRYRDIDPKIRIDCVNSIGFWIHTSPDLFFEGSSLRYLGWLLSDSAAPVRAEVVKQLVRLYKPEGNVTRLRAFTDKFRPRMVEMATQDAETHIRVATIGLLDLIRKLGLLEPDDIDAIGRMIFDSEPKIREKVGSFFAESINDVLEGVVDDLGGEEVLDESLGNEVDDDYDSPRKEWLKLKCLAEVLESYDVEDSEDGALPSNPELLVAGASASRYSLAAVAVCHGVEEAQEWEIIAGYLLYDSSSTGATRGKSDPLANFKKRSTLTEKEERLLLEILHAAVKQRLAEAQELEHNQKKTKTEKNKAHAAQEDMATHLAATIPRLLRKFGATPATASPVLRLEHVLNLGIFQELRQDSSEFASLLEDINRQFLTHADQNVLAEASIALLHAREFEELEEVTETKLEELWDGTISTLRQLTRAKVPKMASLASTVNRIASLASVSDCIDALELEPRVNPKAKSSAPTKALDILLDLIRGYGTVPDPDADVLVSNAMQAVLLYYLWILRSLQDKVQGGKSLDEVPNHDDFTSALVGVIDARPKLDDIRLHAIGVLLDLFTSFASLRTIDAGTSDLGTLVKDVPPKAAQLILSSFSAAEKAYAKKLNRSIEIDDVDAPEEPESAPEDSDEEESDDDADDGPAAQRALRRKQATLLAEKRLVELTSKIVIAIVGRVLDYAEPGRGAFRKRIAQNKMKLGASFKEVLQYLEGPKPKRAATKPKPAAAAPSTAAPQTKSAATVTAEDDEDEIEDAEDGGAEDLRRRELQDDLIDESEGEEAAAPPVDEPEDEIMGD